MNTTEALENLHEAIEAQGLNPTEHLVFDDEDLIVFALNYLAANADHAFEPLNEKIKAVKFEIVRAEGPTHLCGKKPTVTTWKEADAIFREVARTAPVGGGYDKCDFTITFEDGEIYGGRMDVKGDPEENETLAQHVGGFLRFYAGLQKPDHMTQAQYDSFIQMTEKDHPGNTEEILKFLDEYDIPSI